MPNKVQLKGGVMEKEVIYTVRVHAEEIDSDNFEDACYDCQDAAKRCSKRTRLQFQDGYIGNTC